MNKSRIDLLQITFTFHIGGVKIRHEAIYVIPDKNTSLQGNDIDNDIIRRHFNAIINPLSYVSNTLGTGYVQKKNNL